MVTKSIGVLISFAFAVLLLGCGSSGSYQLSWTLDCKNSKDCTIESVRQCSAVGIDTIFVKTTGAASSTQSFACFSSDGPKGSGPGLGEGKITLEVTAISSSGHLVSGPVSVEAEIPGDGLVNVSVDIPRPIACADGVDNDGDGLVDGMDPGCVDAKDTDEK